MEARIVVCLNPFKKEKNLIETVEFENTESLQDIKNEYFDNNVNTITILNGKVIPSENLSITIPKNNSEIIFTPILGDFVSFFMFLLPYLVGMLISTAISMLVGLLAPKPDMGDGGMADTTIYGWNQLTKQQAGTPLYTFYGLNKIKGNVIVAFTESNWTDRKKNFQYLNMLIGVGHGPVADIYEIELNQRDIEYYDAETLDWNVYRGTINQANDPNFTKIVNEISYDFEITESETWAYFETDEADVFTSVELDFVYPNGIYRMNDMGDVKEKTLILYVQYKKDGADEDWQDTEGINITGATFMSVQFRTLFITGLSGGKYYFRIRRDEKKWTYDGIEIEEKKQMMNSEEVRLDGLRMVDTSTLAYPHTAYVAIKVKATDQLSGSLDFQCMVKGKIVRVYDGTSWSFEYSSNPAWVCFDILTQPVISGNGGDTPYSCSRYNGIDPDNVDEDAFLEWANWCDDIVQGEYKRCEFNGGFDTETSMWEAALQVCLIGRAVLVWEGTTITVTYDHPAEPVQLFSVGNLGVSSVKKRWTTKEERANVIEAEFVDEHNDYERSVLTVVHDDMGSENQIARIAMFGITKENQVLRLAKYFLLCNQYGLYTVEWEADVEAINCSIGDVVYLQHSLFDWGSEAKGGLVVSDSYVDGSYHKTLVDSVCEIDPAHPTDYYLYVRFADGTIEYENVISVLAVGTTQTLITTNQFTQLPAKHDRYIFGNATLYEERQKVKITDLELTDEHRVKLTGMQYDKRIYGCDSLLANFNCDVVSGTDPTIVTFLDLSEGDDIDYWEWDFGDGTKSYVQNPPAHTYTAGVFTVKLTVRDGALSDSVTKVNLINIHGTAKSPALITGLKLWLDAQDSSFSLTGSYVDKWSDISGRNYHAYPTSTTAADRPTKTTSDGMASVYFPAVSATGYRHLQLTGIVGNSLMDATEGITMMVVSKNDSADDDRQGVFLTSDVTVSGYVYPAFQAANFRSRIFGDGTATSLTNSLSDAKTVPFPVDKNLNVQTIVIKPGQWVKVYRNGALIATGYSPNVALMSATGVVHIGANSANDINSQRWAFKGHIHAMCVWNKALTDSERIGAELYFSQASKFNITTYGNWVPSLIPNVLGWWNCYSSKKKYDNVYSSVYTSFTGWVYYYYEYFKGLYNLLSRGQSMLCMNINENAPVLAELPTSNQFRGSTYVDFSTSHDSCYLSTAGYYPANLAYPITMFGVFGYCNQDCYPLYVSATEKAIQILTADDKVSLKDVLKNTKVLASNGFYFIMAYLNGFTGTSKLKINGTEVTGVAQLNTEIEYLKMSGKFRFIDMIVVKGDATSYEAQVLAYYAKMTGGYDFTT